VRDSLNQAYYGRAVSPSDILVGGSAPALPDAAPLVSAVEHLITVK
jgi:hypothetical protein